MSKMNDNGAQFMREIKYNERGVSVANWKMVDECQQMRGT